MSNQELPKPQDEPRDLIEGELTDDDLKQVWGGCGCYNAVTTTVTLTYYGHRVTVSTTPSCKW